eukprot:scaffold216882_cov27-Tisochrysis_lutea.AAC.1
MQWSWCMLYCPGTPLVNTAGHLSRSSCPLPPGCFWSSSRASVLLSWGHITFLLRACLKDAEMQGNMMRAPRTSERLVPRPPYMPRVMCGASLVYFYRSLVLTPVLFVSGLGRQA